MKPIPFPGQNKVYRAPINWDEATMGVCRDLPVRQENGEITSCFELGVADRAALDEGANLYLTSCAEVQPVIGWEIR